MTAAPLQGLCVVDGSRGGAGAYCTAILAALGAEVFGHLPSGLKAPTARGDVVSTPWPTLEVLGGLARRHSAEILVVDLEPSEYPGIDEQIRSFAADGLVVISVTAFGLDGPYALNDGPSDLRTLLDAAAAVALTGAHAAVAALAALRWARSRRAGAWAEVSALEVLATCSGEELLDACGRPRPPVVGSARPEVLRCADGYVGVAVPNAVDRAHLAAMVVMTSADPDVEALHAHLTRWLAGRTRMEVFHEAQLWRLPVVPVLGADEILVDEPCAAVAVTSNNRAAGSLAGSPFCFVGGTPSPPPSPRGRGSQRVLPLPLGEAPDTSGRQRAQPGEGAGCASALDSQAFVRDVPVATPRPIDSLSPLADVRVLDLGMVWAGPYCGRLLAHLGAEVIKVEGPARRDGTRPPDGWQGCSGTFSDLNAGKSSLVVNLGTEAGRSAFLRLAAVSDLVVENFTPRVMPNLGLDYEGLAAANPAMVMLSMPAFPSDGPWANYVAYGSGLELATGLWRTGTNDRPEPAPVPFLDYLAGAYGAAGVLASLIARDATGTGCHLEVAQRDVARHLVETATSPLNTTAPIYPSFDGPRLARDPHLSARGLFGWGDGDRGDADGCQHFIRAPWRLGVSSESMPDPPSLDVPGQRAPTFGADSLRVLCEVGGMERLEVDVLVRDGIVPSYPVILTEGKDPLSEPGTDPSQAQDDRFGTPAPP